MKIQSSVAYYPEPESWFLFFVDVVINILGYAHTEMAYSEVEGDAVIPPHELYIQQKGHLGDILRLISVFAPAYPMIHQHIG